MPYDSPHTVYVSVCAPRALREMLSESGRTVRTVEPAGVTYWPVDAHPDILFCRMGVTRHAWLFRGNTRELGAAYPDNCRFNGVCLDEYFIHNLKITSPALLEEVNRLGLTCIHVSQGYTRCNVVVVDGHTVITADRGISRALRAYPDIDVLTVRPGFVRLEGFPYGFLGGASGRVGKTLVFNGDLTAHPDAEAIVSFIKSHHLTPRWLSGYPLTDIGSILCDGES